MKNCFRLMTSFIASMLILTLSSCGGSSSTSVTSTSEPSTTSITPSTSEHSHTYSGEYLYDDTFHYKKCDGCEEIDYKDEHEFLAFVDDGEKHYQQCKVCEYKKYDEHRYGANTIVDEDKHQSTCLDCGHIKESGHKFGSFSIDETNDSYHIRTCSDCGFVEKHIHSKESPFSPCSSCSHQTITETLSEGSSESLCYFYSEVKSVKKDSTYIFEYTTSSLLLQSRQARIAAYSSTESGECVSLIRLDYFDIQIFDDSFNNIDDASFIHKSTNEINMYSLDASETFYIVLSVVEYENLLEGGEMFKLTVEENENIELISFDTLREAYSSNGGIGFDVPDALINGMAIFMKIRVDYEENSSPISFENLKITAVDKTTNASVNPGVRSHDDGLLFTLNKNYRYYVVSLVSTTLFVYDVSIVEDYIAPTSIAATEHVFGEQFTVSSNVSYVFKYVSNNVSKSQLQIRGSWTNLAFYDVKMIDASDWSTPYELEKVNATTGYTTMLENEQNKIFYIILTSYSSGLSKMSIIQRDYITITKDPAGGTLGNQNPIEVMYGYSYSGVSLSLGSASKEGYSFAGWEIVNGENTSSITNNDSFSGKWMNPADSEIDYYHQNGEVTIRATYSAIGKLVELNLSNYPGATFAGGGTTQLITITTGTMLDASYMPVLHDYEFMGFYSEATLTESSFKVIDGNGLILGTIARLSYGATIYPYFVRMV